MVLAGGALAVTACGGSTSAQADAAASMTTDTGAEGDDADINLGPELGCCNANSDPCCPCSAAAASDRMRPSTLIASRRRRSARR